MDWKSLYPDKYDPDSDRVVRFADIGCGYGGLLISLSPMFPDKLMLGKSVMMTR